MGLQCPRPGGCSSHELLCNTNSHFLRGPAGRGGGGGRLWGPGHPPCILLRCLQGSWLKTPWSRLFIKFSLGFFFFKK